MSEKYTISPKNILQEKYQSAGLPLPKYTTIRCGGEDHIPLFRSTVILSGGHSFESSPNRSKTSAEIDAAQRALACLFPPTSTITSNSRTSFNLSSIQPFSDSKPHTTLLNSTSLPSLKSQYSSASTSVTSTQSFSPLQPSPRPSSTPLRTSVSTLADGDRFFLPFIDPSIDPLLTSFIEPDEKYEVDRKVEKIDHHLPNDDRRVYILVDVENVTALEFDKFSIDESKVKILGFLSQYHARASMTHPFEIKKVPTAHREGSDVGIVMWATMLILSKKCSHLIILSRDHFAAALTECVNKNFVCENGPKCYHAGSVGECVDIVLSIR
jgi:hypothetical protein